MEKPQLLDVIRLRQTVVGYGLDEGEDDLAVTEGETGTIVMEVGDSFDVEFSDDSGETIAMATLTADQFEVVWRTNLVVPQGAGA